MAVKRKSGRPAKVPGEKGTKEKIFDAAVDLFAERGYEGVSIRDIAKAVGIKESSVYKHYASKEEILESIFGYLQSKLYQPPSPGWSPASPPEAMSLETSLETGFATIKGLMADPHMLKIMRVITIELYHNEKIRGFFTRTMLEMPVDQHELMFRKLMDAGKIRRFNPRALATAYFAFSVLMYFETFILRYGEPLDVDGIERKSRAHVKLFVDMLKPEGELI